MRVRFAFTVLMLAMVTAATAEEKGAKELYELRCAFCHGAEGKGDGPAGQMLSPPPTNFASAEYWKKADAASLRKTILDGKPGTSMVPFSGSVTAEQVDALIEYMKTFVK
jgi:high-affinity iron transporter